MDYDVTVKESPGLCRCCLSEGCYKDLGSEYSWMNDTEVYADMLLDCFDIGITQHNDGPNGPKRLICEVCITRLRDACNFKKQVVDSEKKFIDMLGRGEFRMEKQSVMLPIYTSAVPMKAEAMEEINLNDDFDDANVEYLEDVDFIEEDEAVKAESPEPTPSSSTSASKRGRPRKANVEPPEKKPKLKTKTKIAKGITLEKEHHVKKKIDAGSVLGLERYIDDDSLVNSATNSKRYPVSQRIDKKQKVKDLRMEIASFINLANAIPFKFFRNKFRCFYCGQEFDLCDHLKEHTRKIHPICEATFRAMKLKDRSAGVRIKIDTSSLSCKMCLQPFPDFDSAVGHLEQEHNANVKNLELLQPFKLVHDEFSCPNCHLKFRSFSTLVKHLNSAHAEDKFMCSDCGKASASYINLKNHIARHHSIATNKCPHCKLVFLSRHELQTHMGKTHGSKVIKCQKCVEKFETQYQKMRHLVDVHNGGHKCPYCAAVFIKYSFMSNHVRRLHLKEKNVQCSVCSLKFFDGNRLKLHMVKHVGGREFRCDYCGRTFLWRKNLVTHMTLHRKNDVVLLR